MNVPISEKNLKEVFAASAGYSPTSDFDLNKDLQPVGRKLRDASVLIPLQIIDGCWNVILTKRSSALKHHPGQIAFPGGKVDAQDASSVDAALRESYEEIGLPPAYVEIIGHLPTHETVTSFLVTPHIGIVKQDFVSNPEIGEVSEVFTVPLKHFQSNQNFKIQYRTWNGINRRYYSIPYGPYYIWGATARMMLLFNEMFEGFDANHS